MAAVKGFVSHIVFRNTENGYTVMEVEAESGIVTLVGILPELNEGEPIEAEGHYTVHPVYGEQLNVEHFSLSLPEDILSIERYLGSGAVKGIGPALAARLVKKFRGDTLRVMEEEPERLAEVKGISAAGARSISEQVIAKKEMREAMMFLEQYGISLRLAVKIYEQYGPKLYDVIRTNPYRLMEDITGIGFRVADEIAARVGISSDSDFRIRSGLCYAMSQALGSGHIYLPRPLLLSYASQLLGIPEEQLDKHVMDLAIDKHFVLREQGDETDVYLSGYYYLETGAASMLLGLDQELLASDEGLEEMITALEKEDGIALEEAQREAVKMAVHRGLMILTGGPGTGKTTTIRTMLRFFEAQKLSISLCAPTGRAAKRITETTGRPAMTIHRLLEFSGMPEEDDSDRSTVSLYFNRNERNPLESDVIIVDEVSMVDLPLMCALLSAIVPGTRLILVGDADQLPSVGPGNVLRDILASGVFPHLSLTKIFRQAEASDIVLNAHRILRGEQIDTSVRSRDFLFVRRDDAQSVINAVLGLIGDKLPHYVGADPLDIQVITPMRKGLLGVENLNRVLQQYLNPPDEIKRERAFARCLFRQGDKVMQIRNNYKKEWELRSGSAVLRSGTGVFNGDIGVISDIRLFTEEIVVIFDENKEVVYSFTEADELELAYAVTVHKSQGSEYPAVILPLLTGPAPLMTRNLIYTAVTRARSCVTVVGSPYTFQAMIDNPSEQKRYSSLDRRLRETVSALY